MVSKPELLNSLYINSPWSERNALCKILNLSTSWSDRWKDLNLTLFQSAGHINLTLVGQSLSFAHWYQFQCLGDTRPGPRNPNIVTVIPVWTHYLLCYRNYIPHLKGILGYSEATDIVIICSAGWHYIYSGLGHTVALFLITLPYFYLAFVAGSFGCCWLGNIS